MELVWQDDADNETGVVIERSIDGSNRSAIGRVEEDWKRFAETSGLAEVKYYYHSHDMHCPGDSDSSHVASGSREGLIVLAGGNVGGTISQNTCWADNGSFTVTSTITVPSGVTLTIKPGATMLVKLARAIRCWGATGLARPIGRKWLLTWRLNPQQRGAGACFSMGDQILLTSAATGLVWAASESGEAPGGETGAQGLDEDGVGFCGKEFKGREAAAIGEQEGGAD